MKPHERQALLFLASGPDQIGVIETDEQMAAAMVFIDLERRGYLTSQSMPEGGPVYSLSDAGVEAVLALQSPEDA